MFILLYTHHPPPPKKVCVFSNNAIKRGHEVLNGRAKMNCVISSSPTPGLRTIHLLRSILFRALPSHAIPADSTLCLHLRFVLFLTWKFPAQVRIQTGEQLRPSRRRCVFHHRSGNSHWISCGFSVLLADAVWFTCCHVDDETLMIWKKKRKKC